MYLREAYLLVCTLETTKELLLRQWRALNVFGDDLARMVCRSLVVRNGVPQATARRSKRAGRTERRGFRWVVTPNDAKALSISGYQMSGTASWHSGCAVETKEVGGDSHRVHCGGGPVSHSGGCECHFAETATFGKCMTIAVSPRIA